MWFLQLAVLVLFLGSLIAVAPTLNKKVAALLQKLAPFNAFFGGVIVVFGFNLLISAPMPTFTVFLLALYIVLAMEWLGIILLGAFYVQLLEKNHGKPGFMGSLATKSVLDITRRVVEFSKPLAVPLGWINFTHAVLVVFASTILSGIGLRGF